MKLKVKKKKRFKKCSKHMHIHGAIKMKSIND